MDIRPLVDASLAREKKLYWLKCQRALQGRRDYRRYALRGVALFLANAPLEYAASRYRHVRKAEPVELNAAAFVLMSAPLLRSESNPEGHKGEDRATRAWAGSVRPAEFAAKERFPDAETTEE